MEYSGLVRCYAVATGNRVHSEFYQQRSENLKPWIVSTPFNIHSRRVVLVVRILLCILEVQYSDLDLEIGNRIGHSCGCTLSYLQMPLLYLENKRRLLPSTFVVHYLWLNKH